MDFKKLYTVVEIQDKELLKPWILEKHYAKRLPSVIFPFGLYDLKEKDFCGICTYGMPAPKMNYGKSFFNDLKINTYELTRLVINEGLPKNILSFFVSQTFKFLKKPVCIVSFADPNKGHNGYIYQATNWLYTGLSQKGGKSKHWILNGRDFHGKNVTVKKMKKLFLNFDNSKTLKDNWILNGGEIIEEKQKHRYIMLLGTKKEKKEMINKLKVNVLPYPKGDNKNYECPDIKYGKVYYKDKKNNYYDHINKVNKLFFNMEK